MYNYGSLGKTTNQKRWTQSTIDCYKRGCNCAGCYYENLLESGKCRCKASVLELVRVLGTPENVRLQEIIE